MLDAASPLPLYQQLADALLAQIRAGDYATGARIPSEHELAQHYGVGRPTVRQATEVLVRRRVLQRRRGAGTFVATQLPEVDLFSLGGTLAAFQKSGVAFASRLIKPVGLHATPLSDDHAMAGRAVYSITRLSSVSRKPVLLERMFFDADVFPALDQVVRGRESMSSRIEEHYRLRPRGGRQTFRVLAAGKEVGALLKLKPTASVLLVKRTLDFPGAPAAIYAELYCHTDEFEFAQQLGDLHA